MSTALCLLVLIACTGPGNKNLPPEAPGDVSANPIPGGIRVVWLDQSTNETEFIVFRAADGDDEPLTEIARVPTDVVRYEDFAVDMGGSYVYAVAATNQFGTSDQVVHDPPDPVSPGVGVRLTVSLDGTGRVDVRNGGQTVACTSHCVLGLAQGTSVTLTATGSEGSAFAGWAGDCSMAGPCTFTINADKDVEARFNKHVLLLEASGDSPVDLLVSPPDEYGATDCTLAAGQSCAFGYQFDSALQVSVNSTLVEPEATFGGYGGACTSPVGRYCLIDVDGETTVEVEVVRSPIVDAKAYQGFEDVTMSVETGAGLLSDVVDTPGDSHEAFVVTEPASGSLTVASDGSFEYLSAQDANAQVTFEFAARDAHGNESAAKTATLTMAAVNDAPTFTIAGNPPATVGNGVEVSRANFATALHPGGGPDETGQALGFTVVRTQGSADLLSAAPVLTITGSTATLTYTPDTGTFGTATYEARLNDDGGVANGGADTSTPHAFTITVSPVRLSTTVTGTTGSGTISRNPVGSEASPGQYDYGWGTDVTLTAAPALGSQFVAWGGACTGTAAQSCVVDLTGAKAVSAEFVAVRALGVRYESPPTTFFSVSSDPAGIDNCNNFQDPSSNSCNGSYTHGQVVTLTANTVVTWSAPCAAGPSATCQITMTADTIVTVSNDDEF